MTPVRHLVVVDTETTGLDVLRHYPIEIAAVNVTTGKELYFVPDVKDHVWAEADPVALQINRYFERGVFKHRFESSWWQLWRFLEDHTFAASNPMFDHIMLLRGNADWIGGSPKPSWHHRLCDLSAYAGAALGLQPHELEGLANVCEALGVRNEGEHTAMEDARATARCFRVLMEKYKPKPRKNK